MNDETPPDPPESPVRLVKSAKRTRSGHVTRALYDQMVDVYVKGNRTAGEIVRECKVHRKTADKAVNKGWPEHNWDSLKNRAAFYDKLQETAQNKESPQRAKEARDFLKMREEYLQIAHGVRSVLAQALGLILQAMPGSTTTSTRTTTEEILDEKGAVVRRIRRTVTVHPSTFDLVAAINQIAGSLDRTGGGELEQIMAKPPSDGLGKRRHKLTTEQITYMAENQGRVPPGVQLEDLGDG